jgi:uncharacterized secreted protein with C-terminal beta-propeller domain
MKSSLEKKLTWNGLGVSLFVVCIVAGAIAFTGCYHVEDWNEIESVEVSHALNGFDDCASFEEYAKLAAIQLMRARVEQARDADADWAGNDDAVLVGASDGDAEGDVGSNHSQTNNQEQGVDEADLIKTDGDYLYSLYKGQLIIVEAGDEGALSEAGRVDVGGYANELFIYNDTAVVFSSLNDTEVPQELRYNSPGFDGVNYDCWDGWCWNENQYARISLVDISDRTSPQVLRTVAYSGEYVTSRRVDNALRVVIYSPLPALETQWYWEDYENDWWWNSVSNVNKMYKKVIQKNEDRINALILDDFMPVKLDSVDGEATYITDCDEVLGSLTPGGIGLTSIISMDLDDVAKQPSANAVFGAKGIVYASTSALYLTTSRQYVMDAFITGLWNDETSGIHKFDIARSDVAAFYLATGSVLGRMLDQFCLGEHNEYLRVATTTGFAGWFENNNLENHVYVLQEQGKLLKTVGTLDGLGLGEEIYAARFMGDKGYLVTFFEMDPLYTLDMSNPLSPKAAGEWHGPGYSTYLHPVGENSVLSVGLEDGRTSLNLYDVSNFASPTLVSHLFFPDWEYSSAAVYEHKAFTFNSESGMLALPYYEHQDNDTGIFLFDVQESGVALTSTLQLNGGSSYYEGAARRSAYIGDYIYGISRCRITSGTLSDPSVALDTIELFNLGSCDDYNDWYWGGGDNW